MPTRQDHARWITHIANATAFRSPARPITASAKRSISTIPRATASRSTTTGRASAGPGRTAWSRCRPSSSTSRRSCSEIDPRTATYPAAPEGLRIGHVHLRVGSCREGRGILSRRARPRPDAAARRRDVHVVGRLSSSRRRQCLAQRRRGPARRDRAGLAWFSIEAADRGGLRRHRRPAEWDWCASGCGQRSRNRRSVRHACPRPQALIDCCFITSPPCRGCGGLPTPDRSSMAAIIVEVSDAAATCRRAARLLGLDIGTKTIGVATSDADRRLATGVETIARKHLHRWMPTLARACRASAAASASCSVCRATWTAAKVRARSRCAPLRATSRKLTELADRTVGRAAVDRRG